MSDNNTTDVLTTIVKCLTPLSPEDRRRTVDAAMLFLGDGTKAAPAKRQASTLGSDASDGTYSAGAQKWMEQYGVSTDELDQVFHFRGDGTFEIYDAPGKSKKVKTLNTYILTGLGKYLAANNREFDDATARAFCETIGCYDAANHAVHLKNKGPEFSGTRAKDTR